jgi:uncharacterized membrane protein (DUF485 family)
MKDVGHKTSGDNSPIQGDINAQELRFQIMPDDLDKGLDDLYNEIKAVHERLEKIERLESEIPELKKRDNQHSPIRLLVLITAFSIVFFALFIWLNRKYHFGISDDGIVLTFVGIIAAFVVIGNYAQVIEIKKEFEKAIENIEGKFQEGLKRFKADKDSAVVVELIKRINDCERACTPLLSSQGNDEELKGVAKKKFALYSDYLDDNRIFINSEIVNEMLEIENGIQKYLNNLNIFFNRESEREKWSNAVERSINIGMELFDVDIPARKRKIEELYKRMYSDISKNNFFN